MLDLIWMVCSGLPLQGTQAQKDEIFPIFCDFVGLIRWYHFLKLKMSNTFLYGFYSQEFDAHSYDQGLGDGESGDVG